MFFLLSVCYSQSDSISVSNEKIRDGKKNAKVEIIKASQINWWEKNEGAFLGAFLAGMVAIFTVLLTNYLNKRENSKRENEIYCGVLFAIKAELEYQYKSLPHLIEELKAILEKSIEAKEVIANKSSRDISVNFLVEIRSKILLLSNYNTIVFRDISAYINKCEIINSDLEFERLIILKEKIKIEPSFDESINNYFLKIIEDIEDIENIRKSIPIIFELINADLASLGKENKSSNISELSTNGS